jgi:hypothetical protein
MDRSNPHSLPTTESAATEGEALVEQLLGLLGGLDSTGGERRLRERYQICCKMQLVPIDPRGVPLAQDTIDVFGKDLSRRGISFSHDLPLTSKRFIIAFILDETHHFVVEAESSWSKRTLIGLYESGCRLIRKVEAH